MAVQVQDVVNASVVLLGIEVLKSQDELKVFQDLVGTEVNRVEGIAMGLQGAHLEAIRKYELPKDRITLETSSGRSTIQREYPNTTDLPRFCEIVSFAIKHDVVQAQTLQALGYNVVLVYELESGEAAHQYLGHRLFKTRHLENEDMKLVGGSGHVALDSPNGRWTVQVEPRFGDEQTPKVYMSVNYHKQVPQLPTLDEVNENVREAWDMSIDFATRIDQG